MVPSAQTVTQPQLRYRIAPHVVACDVESGLALLNVETAAYFALNKVGAAVWASLTEPRTLEDLVAGVMALYDVDVATCRRDVAALVAALEDAKLIQTGD